MAKLNSKKLKKSSFYKGKSLVGLTPGLTVLEQASFTTTINSES
jgi:hypothetical protein